MLFEAELNDKKYQIIVDRKTSCWEVSLQEEGKEQEKFSIPHKEFAEADNIISFLFHGKSYLVDVVNEGTEYSVYTGGSFRAVKIYNDEMLLQESLKSGSHGGDDGGLVSGMPGKIVSVSVAKGDQVKKGEPLLVMEAMKMENEMKATADVTIKDVLVNAGDAIESGATLILFE